MTQNRPVLMSGALLLFLTLTKEGQLSTPNTGAHDPKKPIFNKNSSTNAQSEASKSLNLTLPPHPTTDRVAQAAELEIRQLFRDAKFTEALHKTNLQLQDQFLAAAYRSWLRTQIPAMKLGLAWQWIRKGHCSQAKNYLEQLLNNKEKPLALKGLGFCALKNREISAAKDYLQEYVELKPSDPEAYIMLAEAHESLGDMNESLALTQKAQNLTLLSEEERAELQINESKISAKLEETPTQGEISSGYFIIRYQVTEDQGLIQSSLEILESHIHFLVQTLGFDYPNTPIELIFHKNENFNRAVHGPGWAAAVYDGRIRIPIQVHQRFDEEFRRILRHELTHAMLSERARHQSLPAWFQEGLAQFTECTQLCSKYQFAATSQPFLNAESFENNFGKLDSMNAQIAYRQSLYLILVLTKHYYGPRGLNQIIQQLPQLNQMDSDTLLNQIGLDFQKLRSLAAKSWQEQKSF